MQTRMGRIEELFDQYSDSIYRYARYSLPSWIDARDVVQEVFLRAFRSWPEFQGRDLKTWVFRIARNYIYDELRKKRRRHELESTHQANERAVELDTLVELEDALEGLPPAYRQVLLLRWMQDLTVADTAKVLGWSESKVRITFHRARKQFREVLEADVNPSGESRKGGVANDWKGR